MKKLLFVAAIILGIVTSTIGGTQLADPPGAGGFRTYDPPTTTEPTQPEPTNVDPVVEVTETIL